MASEREDSYGLQRHEPDECPSFLFAVIKDRRRLYIFAFFKQLIIVPKFESSYGFLEHFIP